MFTKILLILAKRWKYVCISGYMDKQIMVYSGVSLSHEKEWNTDNMVPCGWTLNNCAKGKKSDTTDHTIV